MNLPGMKNKSLADNFSDRVTWPAGTTLYPLPCVLVSCGNSKQRPNVITVCWTGIMCSDPPFCYVSIRPERHSHGLIKDSGAFVINFPSAAMIRKVDWCGVKSGRDYDKFAHCGWTPEAALEVDAPLIRECPVNIECRVRETRPLGSHELFMAEIIAVRVKNRYIDRSSGAFNFAAIKPICYGHGKYYEIGAEKGFFGFSVQKKKNRKKKAAAKVRS